MKKKFGWTLLIIVNLVVVLLTACTKRAEPTRQYTAPRKSQPPVAVTKIVEKEVEKQIEITVVAERETGPRATATPGAPPGAKNNDPVEGMSFEERIVSPFIDTENDHLSTFAMDVDTASYTIARRYINEGHLPPQEAIRVEEFVNYFDLAYPGPQESELAFAIHVEGAPSPFGQDDYYMMQVGIQGRRIDDEERKDAILTFVVDVSGSMKRENRLELVKEALNLLVEELRPSDQVGIVAYGSNAFVVLEPTYIRDGRKIRRAINSLHAGGSTYAEEGLLYGYDMAYRAYTEGHINRVILCSDGVANVGRTGAEGILQTVADYREQGITLSSIGVGMGNYNDVMMEELADQGNGNYAYMDTMDEAERIFGDDLVSTLQVIALDSKIQVDFESDVISRYRLIGYENRAIADKDFRNNMVDAGEVGAGHRVTALYEIKFFPNVQLDEAQRALTVHVRYEDPDTNKMYEAVRQVWTDEFTDDWLDSSPGFLLTAAVAEYAEILRGSYWAKDSDLQDVLYLAEMAGNELREDEIIGEDVDEFIWLIKQARQMSKNG